MKKKKNKGGRPRKSGGGKNSERWTKVTIPATTHDYEISSTGLVRRKLKNGKYYNLKQKPLILISLCFDFE